AEWSGDFSPLLELVAEAVEVTPQISGMQARRHSRARPLRARCTGGSYTLQLLNVFDTPFPRTASEWPHRANQRGIATPIFPAEQAFWRAILQRTKHPRHKT